MSLQSESIYSFFFFSLECIYSCFAHNYNGFGHLVSKPTGEREQQIKRVSTGTGRPSRWCMTIVSSVQEPSGGALHSQRPPSITEGSTIEISNDCSVLGKV